MIPILYESTETDFVYSGICRLTDCLSCVVVEERNGVYECDFEYPITGAYYAEIRCGRIIGVRHDDSNDVQPFDIVSYSRPIDGVVSFHAVHISYRQLEMVVRGTNINSLASALSLLGTASPSNPFTYETDITSTNYFAAGDGIPRSVRQMLGGVEGSILDSYGGEFEWDKFTVRLWKNRGQQKEFTIRYGLNMVDFQEDSDYLGTYTSAIPYWTGSDDAGGQVTVVGNRVDSGLTSVSGRDICVPVDLTDKFETKPTASQLQSFMANKMIADAVNLPSQSISVNFVRLEDNEVLSELYKCKLCDSVQVVFSRYNIQRWFKIVRTEFDVLKGRYIKMELGALSTSLSEALGISIGNDGKPYTIGDISGINGYFSGDVYINNDAIDDYIVQHGSGGIWRYRIWKSGVKECFGTYSASIAITTASTAYGGYRSGQLNIPTFPITFTSAPTITATSGGAGGYWFNNVTASTTGGTFYLSFGQSSSATTRHINFHVIGV